MAEKKKEGWGYYLAKKVFVILKSGRRYSGEVIEVIDTDSDSSMCITDKFGQRVCFTVNNIDLIEEERDGPS